MTSTKNKRIELDPHQRLAANAPVGPTIIVGGPGSGKTHTLMGRIQRLNHSGVEDQTITYLTFSAKAAEAAQRTLEDKMPGSRVRINSITQYASYFLRNAGASLLGLNPHYHIWNKPDTINCIEQLMYEMPTDERLNANDQNDFVAWLRETLGQPPQQEVRPVYPEWANLYNLFQTEKTRQGALEIQEVIPLATSAMELYPNIAGVWARLQSRHLLVDEFQDLGSREFRLIKNMVGPEESISIAYDPNQAIYRWRGADRRLVEQFQLEYPQAETYFINLNHRATANLTAMANSVAANKQMPGLIAPGQAPLRPQGPKPQCIAINGTPSQQYQAAIKLVREHHKTDDLDTIAILAPHHNACTAVCSTLDLQNIAYTLLGDNRDNDDDAVRAIISILRLADNPNDHAAFATTAGNIFGGRRSPLRGSAMQDIINLSRTHNTDLVQAGRIVQQVLDDRTSSDYLGISRARRAYRAINDLMTNDSMSVAALCRKANQYRADNEKSSLLTTMTAGVYNLIALADLVDMENDKPIRDRLRDFLEKQAIAPNPEHRNFQNTEPTKQRGGITVATIHAGKGIQWKTVILTDLLQNNLPGRYARTDEDIEEKQRLFYVAITRATDNLYCMAPMANPNGSESQPNTWTCFIETLHEHATYIQSR